MVKPQDNPLVRGTELADRMAAVNIQSINQAASRSVAAISDAGRQVRTALMHRAEQEFRREQLMRQLEYENAEQDIRAKRAQTQMLEAQVAELRAATAKTHARMAETEMILGLEPYFNRHKQKWMMAETEGGVLGQPKELPPAVQEAYGKPPSPADLEFARGAQIQADLQATQARAERDRAYAKYGTRGRAGAGTVKHTKEMLSQLNDAMANIAKLKEQSLSAEQDAQLDAAAMDILQRWLVEIRRVGGNEPAPTDEAEAFMKKMGFGK